MLFRSIKEEDIEGVFMNFTEAPLLKEMVRKGKEEEAKLQRVEEDLFDNAEIEKHEKAVTAQKYLVQEDDKDNEREDYYRKLVEENGQREFENDKEMKGEDNEEKANEEVNDNDNDDDEDEEEEEEELFQDDLLGFAWQITKGMVCVLLADT